MKTYQEFKDEYNITEVLTKETPIKDVIDDFIKSDDERFAGKSKEERRKMAIGAYYGLRKEDLDESEPNENI